MDREADDEDESLYRELRAALRAGDGDGAERVPARFDEFELIRRGGQGAVYRARDRSTGRLVALKVLRRGATARDHSRFEREIEFLRRLDHPGIAAVYDGGVEDGVAFLAMELVAGEHLDRFVERTSPPLHRRLELLADVSDAVAYAHRHGVLHRDLKPGNVLIDGTGQPRVLDFGVARSLTGDGVARALPDPGEERHLTEVGGFVGTLAYASPEQASGRADADVDTRSDVYSLGVMLYQTITGAMPYAAAGTLLETQRAIVEVEPLDPRRRVKGLPRDVATIVLRALAKDPERRTQSAAALAADLRRFLAGEAIEARRDRLVHLAGKWVRRRPGFTLAAALVLLALAGSATWVFRAHLEEERQRHTAEQLRVIFQDLLAAAAPGRMGARVTLLEVFEDVARRIDRDLGDAPDAQAAVRLTIGETYLRLLLLDDAEPHLRAALERYRQFDRGDRLQVARALDALGRTLAFHSRPEAIELHREALRLRLAALGEEAPEVAISRRELAAALLEAYPGPGAAAESPRELLLAALQSLEHAYGSEHAEVAATWARWSALEARSGNTESAREGFRRAIEVFARVAPEDTERLQCLDDYATFLRRTESYEEAEQVLQSSIELARRLHGPSRVVAVLRGFADLHYDRGDLATSERFCAEALAQELERRRELRPDRAARIDSLVAGLRGGTDAASGGRRESRGEGAGPVEHGAREGFAPAFEELRALAGPGAYEVAQWMQGVALLLRREAEEELAETLVRGSLSIGCRLFGADCPVRVRGLEMLGERCLDTGRREEARTCLEEVVATRQRVGTLSTAAGERAVELLARCRESVGSG